MRAIETLAAALYAACLRDLPDIEWQEIDPASERRFLNGLDEGERLAYYEQKRSAKENLVAFAEERGVCVQAKSQRPQPDACEISMFRQEWPSTALGYGGIGGQAMSPAYTVIVTCERSRYAAVYFGCGRLAYLVPPEKKGEAWRRSLAEHAMPSCESAAREHKWYRFISRNDSAS